ncbi:MAG: hypothetical protein MZV70_43310 [Desulfobacterales bacterium]|nr:hypothetical protein [Desulfobacterales bacterium]
MLDAVRGTVESTEDGVLLLSVGPLTLEFLVPAYFLPELRSGDSIEVFTHFQFVNEGARTVPMAVAFPCVADRTFSEASFPFPELGREPRPRLSAQPPRPLPRPSRRGDMNFLGKALPGIGSGEPNRSLQSFRTQRRRHRPTSAGIRHAAGTGLKPFSC